MIDKIQNSSKLSDWLAKINEVVDATNVANSVAFTANKAKVVVSSTSSWIDSEYTEACPDENLPNLVTAQSSYILDSPLGKIPCACIVYTKIDGNWILVNEDTYSANSELINAGTLASCPGDGKIYVSCGNYLSGTFYSPQSSASSITSAEIAIMLVPAISAQKGKCAIIVSETNTWVGHEEFVVTSADLPNPVSCGMQYEITSPFGDSMCICVPYLKIDGVWVAMTGQYSQQYSNGATDATGIFAGCNGDGKIYLTTGFRALSSWGNGAGLLAPIVDSSTNIFSAECMIVVVPVTTISDATPTALSESTPSISGDSLIIVPENTTFSGFEDKTIVDANLPNPLTPNLNISIDCPFGNTICDVKALYKIDNSWVEVSDSIYSSQSGNYRTGALCSAVGDGKINIVTGSSYIFPVGYHGVTSPVVTIADSKNVEVVLVVTPLVGNISNKKIVITPQITTWIDFNNTESIVDANLSNPVSTGQVFELSSPFGNDIVFCDVLMRLNGEWCNCNAQAFNASGNSTGVFAYGPGDGKIYVSTGSSYLYFNDSESKGWRVPNRSGVSSAGKSAEIVVVCHH